MLLENPFPGHNPFIEQRWADFHARLNAQIADTLQYGLPDDLRARVEERTSIETFDEEDGPAGFSRPDVRVSEVPGRRITPSSSGATAVLETLDEPLIASIAPIERIERSILIIDRSTGGRVVTVIELLSPSNKRGQGTESYLKRQQGLLRAGVNLVEVDLIRAGKPVTLARGALLRRRPDRYFICSYKASDPDNVAIWRASITHRLPTIRIPLRPRDPDLALELQSVYQQCFARGRYDEIDYTRPLDPAPDDVERGVIEPIVQRLTSSPTP